ncbi:MAG TPA: YetF domain-containing protein [Leptolyngbyaceae cyanobacterium]
MMELLFKVDWYRVFVPSTSVAELFVRGSLVYLMLFAILRFLPNRQIGTVGISDLLVVVLFAEAAQNAMASNYTAIADGAILVTTIILWSYSLNWLGYKFPRFQKFLSPPPMPLVKNGRILRANMEQQLITQDELMSILRQKGVHKLSEVKLAFMESDGNISIITYPVKREVLPNTEET